MTAAIQRPDKSQKSAAAGHRPTHVAVITHYFSAHGGGIELVADRLIRELKYTGSFTFSWISSDCDAAPQLPDVDIEAMKCCNAFEKALGFPWPIWSLKSIKRMTEVIGKSDVVWLHDTLYLGNILAFIAARKAKKPVIVTQHIAPIPYKNPITRWLMKTADRFITGNILQRANEVIFVSDRVADEYYARVPFTHPIKIIPNGVDARIFHPAITENRRFIREQFALRNDQPVFLFVGRFVEKKGLAVIRKLATQLPDCRFWLAGSGPINPEKWLLPNVHVMSNRKNETLAELYQASDLLLLPSFGEGFPLVIQEAMACGLPVLCGPSTAQGCLPAKDHLYIADVLPDDATKTAAIWLEKIKRFPRPLPMIRPREDLIEFALYSWDWTAIAKVYADILKTWARPSGSTKPSA